MGRPCTACGTLNLAALNKELLVGTPVVELAQKYRLSVSALRRHKSEHTSGVLLREVRAAEQMDTGRLVGLLVEGLRDAASVRTVAVMQGRGDLLLKAVRETRATVETLMGKLGLDSSEVAKALQQGDAVTLAVARVTKANPELGRAVIDRLRAEGEHELADDFALIAERSEQQLELSRGQES